MGIHALRHARQGRHAQGRGGVWEGVIASASGISRAWSVCRAVRGSTGKVAGKRATGGNTVLGTVGVEGQGRVPAMMGTLGSCATSVTLDGWEPCAICAAHQTWTATGVGGAGRRAVNAMGCSRASNAKPAWPGDMERNVRWSVTDGRHAPGMASARWRGRVCARRGLRGWIAASVMRVARGRIARRLARRKRSAKICGRVGWRERVGMRG